MPLHIGPDAPDAVHIGPDLADKVMSGGVQVWPEPTVPDLPVVGRWLTRTANNSPPAGRMCPNSALGQWRINVLDLDGVSVPVSTYVIGGLMQFGAGTPHYTISLVVDGTAHARMQFTEISPEDLYKLLGRDGVTVEVGYQAP